MVTLYRTGRRNANARSLTLTTQNGSLFSTVWLHCDTYEGIWKNCSRAIIKQSQSYFKRYDQLPVKQTVPDKHIQQRNLKGCENSLE